MPVMVKNTTEQLKHLKSFLIPVHGSKIIMSVFTDPAQLGRKHIAVSDEEKATFLEKNYCPYIQCY